MASRRTKPLELWLSRQILRGLLSLPQGLSHRSALALGARLGDVSYHLFPRYRRVALANLTRAYGDVWGPRKVEDVARETFRNVGRTLLEFVRIPVLSPSELERLVRLEGHEHVQSALARGRGAMLVTAHYGNWELLAARVVQHGYTLNVITRTADDAGVNETINAIRRRAGIHVIERKDSIRSSLECLRRNELLAVLIDQNALVSSVWVDFFGRPAATHVGAALLARRTGAALIPSFDRRLPDGTHVGFAYPPLYVEPTEDKERDIREMTARLTQFIEREVRNDPAQWLWLHNRWKHQPEPEYRCENPASHHAV